MKKGLFIVFEGIDGSGKGTHAKLLLKWLIKNNYEAVLTTEPTDSDIGKLLREKLQTGGLDARSEALLFAADRVQHDRYISYETQCGRIVISDRYVHSSIAYQGARGLDIEWIKTINDSALRPDILILLDIDPELAIERVNRRSKKGDYFEELEFLKKVRAGYLDQGALVVDSSAKIEKVHEEIVRITSNILRKSYRNDWYRDK